MTRSTQPGLRFRTRKLAPKNLLAVLREDQIDSEEYKELLDNQYKVETGVEKGEENVSYLFLVYICHISRDVIDFDHGEAQRHFILANINKPRHYLLLWC